jgi:FHA domain
MSLLTRPLPGPGLAVRAGDLFAVCADDGAGVPDVLALVHAVAAEGGDGADLVRRAADLLEPVRPACALAGLTGAGEVAVLVCGAATADVTGPQERIQLSGPAPVRRLVTGPVSTLRLALPEAGAADPRTRLDAGVVAAAGIAAELGQAAHFSLAPADAVVTARRPATAPRQPDLAAPFESVLLVPGHAGAPPHGPPIDATAGTQPLIEGVYCKNEHFNDPALRYCQLCGISMAQLTQVTRLGPRPPLGVLLLDDGTTFRLDADYVVGRDPEQDPDVGAGRARALRITGAMSGVSRRHLRLALSGWNVQVIDLGSANGTYVTSSGDGGPHRIAVGVPVVIRPGSQVAFGRRWLRYESHRNP